MGTVSVRASDGRSAGTDQAMPVPVPVPVPGHARTRTLPVPVHGHARPRPTGLGLAMFWPPAETAKSSLRLIISQITIKV